MKTVHYCKICGIRTKSSICEDCEQMSPNQRKRVEIVNQLVNLPLHLTVEQKNWLERMRKDPQREIRETAEWAYELRF